MQGTMVEQLCLNGFNLYKYIFIGGQLDKLCFSVRPPYKNELHTICHIMYFCWENKILELET